MKKDEQLEFDTNDSSPAPTPAPAFTKPPRAGSNRVFAHISEETDWQTETSSNALSRMFIAVLALHVLVVVGILVHEMMKAKSGSAMAASSTQMAQPSPAPVEAVSVTPPPAPAVALVTSENPVMADIPLPPPVETVDYNLKRGDTLNSIASTHKTTVAEIRALNNLNPTDVVSAGKTIKLPKAKVSTASLEAPADIAVAEPAKDNVKTHVVGDSDTLYGIAKRYNMKVTELQALNPKVNAKKMKKGMVIKLSK